MRTELILEDPQGGAVAEAVAAMIEAWFPNYVLEAVIMRQGPTMDCLLVSMHRDGQLCEECGAKFRPTTHRQRFCTTQCGNRNRLRHHRERAKGEGE